MRDWKSIKNRYLNPTAGNYDYYGGRRITVCKRWRESCEAFLEDMGERPEGMVMELINNSRPYSCGKCEECKRKGWPMNCRWTTRRSTPDLRIVRHQSRNDVK